jgi:hypothetical protein
VSFDSDSTNGGGGAGSVIAQVRAYFTFYDREIRTALSFSHSILLSLHSRCRKIRLNDGIVDGFGVR